MSGIPKKKPKNPDTGSALVRRGRDKQAILHDLNLQLKTQEDSFHNHSLHDGQLIMEGYGISVQNDGFTNTNSNLLQPILPPGRPLPVRPLPVQHSAAPTSTSLVPKRNVKSSRTLSRAGSNVISKYRPDYTWNKGGRMKEIRIRCLARKYLFLWIQRVYGRVTPTIARLLYEKRVKKRIMTDWVALWWEARKGWGLTVRAELHYRGEDIKVTDSSSMSDLSSCHQTQIRLLNFASFLSFNRHLKVLIKIDPIEANSRKLQRALKAWLTYTQYRKIRRAANDEADRNYQLYLLHEKWLEWKNELVRNRYRREQESLALHMWAQSAVAVTWIRWKIAYDHSLTAVQHHHLAVKRRNLERWRCYTRAKRNKRKINVDATKFSDHWLVASYFVAWRHRYQHAKAVSHHEQHMFLLAQSFKIRRCLVHWKHFVILKRESQQKAIHAVDHYKRQLKLLRQSWRKWCSRLETKEEIALLSLSNIARGLHSRTIMRRTFALWKRFSNQQSQLQMAVSRAVEHYNRVLLSRSFTVLCRNIALMQLHKQNKVSAEQFFRLNAEWKYLMMWRWKTEQSQEVREMERIAVLHYDYQLTRFYLVQWCDKTQQRLGAKANWDTAVEHFHGRLVCKVFVAWRQLTADTRNERELDHLALHHWHSNLIRRVWSSWQKYAEIKKKSQTQKLKATKHHQVKVMRKSFEAFRRRPVWLKQVLAVMQEKLHQRNVSHLRSVFQHWRKYVSLRKKKTQLYNVARQHHSRRVLLLVLTAWHEFAAVHAYKKLQTAEKVRDVQQILHQGVLYRYFHRWHVARDDVLLFRLKYQRAVTRHDNRLLGTAFKTWRHYVIGRRRKQLLQRQCIWFHNKRITAVHFVKWRLSLALQRQENAQTCRALWYWSLTVEHKVFSAWCAYVDKRRQKAARYAEALDIYRHRLLVEGATKWLSVSADMAQLRMKFAGQKGVKSYYRIHQIALKCASHWRQVVARRKARRGLGSSYSGMNSKPAVDMASRTRDVHVQHTGQLKTATISPTASQLLPQLQYSVSKFQRPAPKRPTFMMQSLTREGLAEVTQGQELSLRLNDNLLPLNTTNSVVEEPLDTFHATTDIDNGSSTPRSVLPELSSMRGQQRSSAEISVTVTDQLLTDEADIRRAHLTSDILDVNSTLDDGQTQRAQISVNSELLPPTAFLHRRDGTPLVAIENTDVLHESQQQVKTSGAMTEASRQAYVNGAFNAAELVEIRRTLRVFADNKEKLKRYQNTREQLERLLNEMLLLLTSSSTKSSEQFDERSDPEIFKLKQEILQLDEDIATLSAIIASSKAKAHQLAIRVTEILGTSS